MKITRVWQQLSNKWCIKYECTNCGHDLLNNVGFIKPNISETKELICPKCKSFGKDDYKNTLKLRVEELTDTRSNIDIEIEKILREIETIEAKAEERTND